VSRVYLDNDVSPHLVRLLEARGHSATTAHDLGLASAHDEVQLLTAVQRQAILVTSNRRDFVVPHRAWTIWSDAFGGALSPHHGILAIAQAELVDQSEALNTLLAPEPVQAFPNRMLWWPSVGDWQEWVGTAWIPFVGGEGTHSGDRE
jgi:hypothetical protein